MEGVYGNVPTYKSKRGKKPSLGKTFKQNIEALKTNGVKKTKTGVKIIKDVSDKRN